MMVMNMDFRIDHEALENEIHTIPGCPVFSTAPWTEIPSRGVGLSMRPAVLNCVLFSAWRQGLLRFPVPIPGELAFVDSEVSMMPTAPFIPHPRLQRISV